MVKTEQVTCPVCNVDTCKTILISKDYRYGIGTGEYTIVQCVGCGMIYLNPRLDITEIEKHYPENYYSMKAPVKGMADFIISRLQQSRVKQISRHKKAGKILDVGCGTGEFLSAFKGSGWERYGADLSENACEIAKSNLDGTVNCGELSDCNYPDKYFDVIVLNHSFEHMYKPGDVLNELNRILKDDGILSITVPNVACTQVKIFKEYWLHLDVPRHVYFYSPKSLRDLLESHEFAAIAEHYPVLDFPFDSYKSLKHKYSHENIHGLQNILLYLMLPLSVIIKILPSFRSSFEVIAKKNT